MNPLMQTLEQLHITTIFQTILLILIGFFVARIVSVSMTKAFSKRLSRQQNMLLQRFTYYLILALFLVSAIEQIGFHITAILGATGILTVALGIASQTSMSNIVSGVFIIGEKPFEIGNTIRVNDIEGEVISIDLLSVKIRTGDNLMVRVPNETLIKSSVTNLSFFPNRRVDIFIGVAYKENLSQVKNILLNVAEKNNLCLKNPEPAFLITGFGDSAINLRLSVWSTTDNYSDAKNSIQEDIKKAFEDANIEIPYPSQAIFAGSNSEPLPIKIISSG